MIEIMAEPCEWGCDPACEHIGKPRINRYCHGCGATAHVDVGRCPACGQPFRLRVVS